MRVLLATDGSDDARAATEWLALLPLPEPTSVHVLAVVTLPRGPVEVPTVRAFHDELRLRGRHLTAEARAVLTARWPNVDEEVREGDPREQVTRAAEECGADMIVVGGRGLGAFKGWLLGSVSTAVVREAHCPVLVVTGARSPLTRITIAIDGSADSRAAARFVASWPLPATATIRLLGVVEPMQYPPAPLEMQAPAVFEALEEDLRQRESAMGDTLADVANALPTPARTEISVVVGSPAERIVMAANEPDVDLVVVGARGLGAVKRLVLGSVSERVLHHATCPVLVVKTSHRRSSS
jgi:nucleotide-binding universal stress UspA family protein